MNCLRGEIGADAIIRMLYGAAGFGQEATKNSGLRNGSKIKIKRKGLPFETNPFFLHQN